MPSDVAYVLLVHDDQYPGTPSQVAGVFGDAQLAMDAASARWVKLAGPVAMPLTFTSYNSSHTGLDFHISSAYRDRVRGAVTYSVNGFHIQRA